LRVVLCLLCWLLTGARSPAHAVRLTGATPLPASLRLALLLHALPSVDRQASSCVVRALQAGVDCATRDSERDAMRAGEAALLGLLAAYPASLEVRPVGVRACCRSDFGQSDEAVVGARRAALTLVRNEQRILQAGVQAMRQRRAALDTATCACP
jgi:hypothetical protein